MLEGTKYWSEDPADGALVWAAFNRADVQAGELTKWLDDHPGFYGGPGRPFAHAPTVRWQGSRVLCTQSAGWDV